MMYFSHLFCSSTLSNHNALGLSYFPFFQNVMSLHHYYCFSQLTIKRKELNSVKYWSLVAFYSFLNFIRYYCINPRLLSVYSPWPPDGRYGPARDIPRSLTSQPGAYKLVDSRDTRRLIYFLVIAVFQGVVCFEIWFFEYLWCEVYFSSILVFMSVNRRGNVFLCKH